MLPHLGAGRTQLFQHVGDDYLQQSLLEEPLPYSAAVIVIFLGDKGGEPFR